MNIFAQPVAGYKSTHKKRKMEDYEEFYLFIFYSSVFGKLGKVFLFSSSLSPLIRFYDNFVSICVLGWPDKTKV